MINSVHTLIAEADIGSGLVGAAFGALIGAFVTHRMSRDAATKDRVRAARTSLRKLIDQASGEDGLHAYSAHREFCPVIFELKHSAYDDIRWWRRQSFARACDAFLSIPGDDLQPRNDPAPIGVPRTKEAKEREEQEHQRPVKLLTDSLTAILKTT